MIIFDVGANYGTDSIPKIVSNKHYIGYAFEPTPELIAYLHRASQDFSDRYHIQPIALSNFDGMAEFNIATHADWGVSSLLEFNDNLHETWPGRTDFYVDRKEMVQVKRFDTWFEETKPPISKIDYFHCDTQGSDLAVLQGMADYIDLIVEGVVEVPHTNDVQLYKNHFKREEMEDYLNERGFVIHHIGMQQNEDNLFFRKK